MLNEGLASEVLDSVFRTLHIATNIESAPALYSKAESKIRQLASAVNQFRNSRMSRNGSPAEVERS